jgi:hypothetical protein
MTPRELALWRTRNLRLGGPPLSTPSEVVAWCGAVQSQEFSPAKWSLGQRLEAADDAMVEAAFHRGEILRTHLLRPTWHFVAPPISGGSQLGRSALGFEPGGEAAIGTKF